MDGIFFKIIASSSKGNCAFLRIDGLRILIEAGISARRIKNELALVGETIEDLDMIFITHHHSDHCEGLGTLSKYANISVITSELTCDIICAKYPKTKNISWKTFESGESFHVKNLRIETCKLSHDGDTDTVAYKISNGKKTFVWMTDLGATTRKQKDFVQNANVLVLESNYCPALLKKSDRPQELKRRISSDRGHLSNIQSIEFLSELNANTLEKIFLAHISRDCNTLDTINQLLISLPEIMRKKIELVDPFDNSPTLYIC